MSESRWAGKIGIVTGASAGIGPAVARQLWQLGMHVCLLARRQERLDALAAELGERATVYGCDIRDEARLLEVFADVRQRHGGVDVLVNNAGLGHAAPLMSGETEQWREMLEVNVLALCVATREAVKDMTRSGGGHVIHLSSMAAHRVPAGSGVYSATKYAVRALTEGLRQELRAAGSPIRVTSISPGFVETEFAAHFHKSEDAAREAYGRFPVLQPDDIASAVRYVLEAPEHMAVHDMLIRPTQQPS